MKVSVGLWWAVYTVLYAGFLSCRPVRWLCFWELAGCQQEEWGDQAVCLSSWSCLLVHMAAMGSWRGSGCYRLNVCVPPRPAKVICWNTNPNVMALGGGTFGKWLGHGGSTLMNEITAFIKETPESTFVSFAMRGHSEKMAVCELGSGLSPDTESASKHLDLKVLSL